MALAALLVLGSTACVIAATDPEFPTPPELVPAVRLWIDLFTRYSQRDVVIHDRLEPGRVYDVVRGGAGDEAEVAKRLDAVAAGLRAAGVFRTVTPAPSLIEMPPALDVTFAVEAPLERLRTQRGMRETFADALAGQRRYQHIVRTALARAGLPGELAAVPLIESSYNPEATSRAGAVGLWQLTAATAERYLRISGNVDERRNPVRASDAAARHLHELREALPSWPLALTAYNHGLAGVERARRQVGSDDLGALVTRYRGPGFGFASRSFYAEFLAASHVARHVGRYFPDLAPDHVIEYRVKPGDTLYALARRHGVTVPKLLVANRLRSPALQPGQVLLIRL